MQEQLHKVKRMKAYQNEIAQLPTSTTANPPSDSTEIARSARSDHDLELELQAKNDTIACITNENIRYIHSYSLSNHSSSLFVKVGDEREKYERKIGYLKAILHQHGIEYKERVGRMDSPKVRVDSTEGRIVVDASVKADLKVNSRADSK